VAALLLQVFLRLTMCTGPQIGWQTTFVVEYIGPLLIHPLVYALRPLFYRYPHRESFPPPTELQTLSLILICTHFVKREMETLFIHRFSAATMPLRNIFKNSFHYWILSGCFIAAFTYGPGSRTAAGDINSLVVYTGVALFVIGELGNLSTHLTLRGLRSSGGKERGIPKGLGFDLVTCPNYMFEAVAWVGMTLVTQNLATLVFTLISIAQMSVWAKKKEKKYRNEFGDKYKKKRFGMLPGLL
jgi:very-long-chain enoyl-CoA reductase